jgi:hypothetical protein
MRAGPTRKNSLARTLGRPPPNTAFMAIQITY